MADEKEKKRQLKIKTGVVKRLAKEKQMYEKEASEQEEKITKMKEDSKDEYDIKKQIEVLNESRAMVPDTKRRLCAACEDLQSLRDQCSDLAETEEFKAASTMLEQTKVE